MNGKKLLVLALAVCLVTVLLGCGSANAVYVQSVEVLSNLGGIAPGDYFLGMVVSEHVTKIEKDSDKGVKELLVQEGERLYQILQVRFGSPEPMTLVEEWVGRQSPDQKQPLRALLLTRLLEKTQRAIRGISRGNGDRNLDRLEQLHQLYQQLDSMKKEWDAWQQ